MFDIGFSELFVIAVVALIVVGPERLPRVARTAGLLFGRLQRYVSDVKADISREIELDELRKLQSTVQDAAKDIEQSVSSQMQYVENEVRQTEQAVESAVAPLSGINLMPDAQQSGAAAPAEGEQAPPQLELGLDNKPQSEPVEKQA